MKTLILSFVFILTACTSKEIKSPPVYKTINELWIKKGSFEELKKILGTPEIVEGKIAEYMFSNSKVPKMHFQFDANGHLETALLILDITELHEFKNFIECEWIEKAGKEQTADFIDKTHDGQCKSKPIRFSYFSSLNSYQVWWDKK